MDRNKSKMMTYMSIAPPASSATIWAVDRVAFLVLAFES